MCLEACLRCLSQLICIAGKRHPPPEVLHYLPTAAMHAGADGCSSIRGQGAPQRPSEQCPVQPPALGKQTQPSSCCLPAACSCAPHAETGAGAHCCFELERKGAAWPCMNQQLHGLSCKTVNKLLSTSGLACCCAHALHSLPTPLLNRPHTTISTCLAGLACQKSLAAAAPVPALQLTSTYAGQPGVVLCDAGVGAPA